MLPSRTMSITLAMPMLTMLPLLVMAAEQRALGSLPALPPDTVIGTGDIGTCKEEDFDRALDILNDWGRTASGMIDGNAIPTGAARPVRILFDCGPPGAEVVIPFTTEKQINFFAQGDKKFKVRLVIEGKCGSAPVVFDGQRRVRLFNMEIKVKGKRHGFAFFPDRFGGGGVHLELKNVILRDGAAIGDGGCVFGFENGRLNLVGTRFERCMATGEGGCVAMKSGMMMVRDTVFQHCSSGKHGGAVSLRDVANGAWATFERTRFTSNTAGSEGGGAIYLRGKDDAARRASVFANNMTSMLTAGVGSIQSGEFIFKDCEFANNSLSKNGVHEESGTGGAMLVGGPLLGTNSKFLSLQDVLFFGNAAANGGGALHTQNVAQINANNVYFVNNDVGYDGDTKSDKMGLGGAWRVNKCQIDAHSVVFSGNIGLVGGAFSWDHAWQNRGHLVLQNAVFEKTRTRDYSALMLWSVPNRTLRNVAFCRNHVEKGEKASSFSNIRACHPDQSACAYKLQHFGCLYDNLTFGMDTWGANARLRTTTWPIGKGAETCTSTNTQWPPAGDHTRKCNVVCDGSNSKCKPRNLMYDVCQTGTGAPPLSTSAPTTAPDGWHLVVSTGFALTSGVYTPSGQQQNGRDIFRGPFGALLQYEVKGSRDGNNWGATTWLRADGWYIIGGAGGHHRYGLATSGGAQGLCDQSGWKTRHFSALPVQITGCQHTTATSTVQASTTVFSRVTTTTVRALPRNRVIEKATRVGAWGGSCTCPDGAVFQVGDNADFCGSLACVGGTPGKCNRRNGAWSNRKVVCARAASATTVTTTRAALGNRVIEKAIGVGAWGGSCTCPDGAVFQVGDNADFCGSLACVGGTPGKCNRRNGAWSNRKVVCAQAANATTATTTRAAPGNRVIDNALGVGDWGGSCTCPDGIVFQVGDNRDFCGSLACVGGLSGTCSRRSGAWSKRKVLCAPSSFSSLSIASRKGQIHATISSAHCMAHSCLLIMCVLLTQHWHNVAEAAR